MKSTASAILRCMFVYSTLVEGIEDLKKRGYSLDLNNEFDEQIHHVKETILFPKDFIIEETYRFEGDSNPSDEDILFAMISKNKKIKGFYSSAFGVYGESLIINQIEPARQKNH